MEEWMRQGWLFLAGGVAGLVDSIAGGGGLISLPAISMALEIGPHAIGTNKLVASTSGVMALIVYARKGHLDVGKSLLFAASVGSASLVGSLLTPLLPAQSFQWILAITCPTILWVVWRKDLWVAQELKEHPSRRRSKKQTASIVLSGLVCGLYDGAWGPGAGTFMLLALLFFVRLPLFAALAASKLANSASALVSLASYAVQGYVHWREGAMAAVGVAIGAYIGAHLATRKATRIVRPVLVCVVGLLMVKLLSQR